LQVDDTLIGILDICVLLESDEVSIGRRKRMGDLPIVEGDGHLHELC
jgi:hypothetical protein